MKRIKYELQNIIIGNGQDGHSSQLKNIQNFLRRNAQSGKKPEKQQHIKSEEEKLLIAFAKNEGIIFTDDIPQTTYIGEGAEQKVYRYDNHSVIKLNSCVFYESWLDYFNSLLIHNYFFNASSYDFLGFKIINEELFAVVKQDFILATEITNLDNVRSFLEYNSFSHIRNNDYHHLELGLIFEDLHDENVLCHEGLLYFIDTIFYITPDFYTP
jgi:hypothetical protein